MLAAVRARGPPCGSRSPRGATASAPIFFFFFVRRFIVSARPVIHFLSARPPCYFQGSAAYSDFLGGKTVGGGAWLELGGPARPGGWGDPRTAVTRLRPGTVFTPRRSRAHCLRGRVADTAFAGAAQGRDIVPGPAFQASPADDCGGWFGNLAGAIRPVSPTGGRAPFGLRSSVTSFTGTSWEDIPLGMAPASLQHEPPPRMPAGGRGSASYRGQMFDPGGPRGGGGGARCAQDGRDSGFEAGAVRRRRNPFSTAPPAPAAWALAIKTEWTNSPENVPQRGVRRRAASGSKNFLPVDSGHVVSRDRISDGFHRSAHSS